MQLQLLLICSVLSSGLPTYYLPYDQGERSDHSHHPYAKYVVSIQTKLPRSQYFGTNHFCVGTIVAPIYVLTASHCILDSNRSRLLKPDELLVIAGAPNRRRPTEHTRILHIQSVHPYSRNRITFNHDLTLLRLQDNDTLDLNLTLSLGIAQLATHQPYAHSNCIVLGWGRAQMKAPFAEELMPRVFQVQPQKYCQSVFPVSFRKELFCATVSPEASQDVCGGDSGGPLICGNQLMGIVTRGVLCDRRYPALFVSVASHRRWIKRVFSGVGKSLPLITWLSLNIIY
ncbi:putative trypsin-6 isoform X1 [Drosophila montana]|uniref:putative trypsin-6 isoform X1 n=1 Tax=Drosophila montana TaxID=40370 RepID=UPI00313CB568